MRSDPCRPSTTSAPTCGVRSAARSRSCIPSSRAKALVELLGKAPVEQAVPHVGGEGHFDRRLDIGHRAPPDAVELLAEAIRRDEEA
jgi:hypothetical protein